MPGFRAVTTRTRGVHLPGMRNSAVDPTPPAAGTLFVEDSFTDTGGTNLVSHTGETGATWTQHTNGNNPCRIAANRVRPTNASAISLIYTSGVPAAADYDVLSALYVASLPATTSLGMVARQSTSANTGYHGDYSTGNGEWRIYKIVAGSSTVLVTSSATLTVGQTYALRFTVRGTTLALYVDGTRVLSTTDSSISAAGRAALRTNQGTVGDAVGLQYDYFKAINV